MSAVVIDLIMDASGVYRMPPMSLPPGPRSSIMASKKNKAEYIDFNSKGARKPVEPLKSAPATTLPATPRKGTQRPSMGRQKAKEVAAKGALKNIPPRKGVPHNFECNKKKKKKKATFMLDPEAVFIACLQMPSKKKGTMVYRLEQAAENALIERGDNPCAIRRKALKQKQPFKKIAKAQDKVSRGDWEWDDKIKAFVGASKNPFPFASLEEQRSYDNFVRRNIETPPEGEVRCG